MRNKNLKRRSISSTDTTYLHTSQNRNARDREGSHRVSVATGRRHGELWAPRGTDFKIALEARGTRKNVQTRLARQQAPDRDKTLGGSKVRTGVGGGAGV